MRRVHNALVWLGNWRNLVGIAALTVAGTLSAEVMIAEYARADLRSVVSSQISAENAANARAAALEAQAAKEIAGLESVTSADGQRISQLVTEVQALDAQVAALGARPVVIESSPPSSATTSPTSATPSSRTATHKGARSRPHSSAPTPTPPSCSGGIIVLNTCLK